MLEHKEQVINGVLHWKNGENWVPYTSTELTLMLLESRNKVGPSWPTWPNTYPPTYPGITYPSPFTAPTPYYPQITC